MTADQLQDHARILAGAAETFDHARWNTGARDVTGLLATLAEALQSCAALATHLMDQTVDQ